MWDVSRKNCKSDYGGDFKQMKERLDVLLVNKGISDSRDKAKRLIMTGRVFVDKELADKPGTKYSVDSDISIKGEQCQYVGRGGLKLEKAIELFNLDLNGYICVDMGASTGGFTDCMLKNGAIKVYAIDVGYGQLAYKLRTDDRVVNLEKTNIRYLDVTLIDDPIDLISIDVSFISTKHMFPVASEILKDEGIVICLIKPQFEAGKDQVGKGGIVKDSRIHADVIHKVISYAKENDLYLKGLTFSPIKGAKGNIEFLAYFVKGSPSEDIDVNDVIDKIIELSHEELDKYGKCIYEN